MSDHFDVLVIGSGGGMLIARGAAAAGKRVALVEKGPPGGTCLNRGCIPSKMLAGPAMIAATIRNAGRVNLEVTGGVRIDFSGLVQRVSGAVDGISDSLRDGLAATENLTFLSGAAIFTGHRRVRVGEREISADHVFIATGSRPLVPDIPGLAGTPFMTSTEALRCTELPPRMIVIGAGYIAVELGNAYTAAGCAVDFVVRSRLLRKLDREIAAEFARRFAGTGTLHPGCTPTRVVWADGVFIVTCADASGNERTLEAEALLVATGVEPETDQLGLDRTGVTTDSRGYVVVDECLRTAAEGVWALGDVVGNYFFRHTVNYEAAYLLKTAFSVAPSVPLDYGPVPYAVFSHPEIAGVGLSEEHARERGIRCVVGRASYADSNQALARGLEVGLVKVLIDRDSRRLIGAHIVGEEAPTMIHLFIALMKKQGTLDDLLDMIFIHPALPEVARDAARDAGDTLARA